MEEPMEVTSNTQAEYPKKQPTRVWDPVRVEYPVRKFPDTGQSSTTIGHDWIPSPEVLKQLPTRTLNPVHVEYPVRKFPDGRDTSSTIGHDWIPPLEVLKQPVTNEPLECIKEYYHDYNVDRNLMRSQSTLDFGHKHPETKRHNKHTSCEDNLYIYPPSRRLADRPPQCRVHGSTEMRSAYKEPETPARLVTGKQQFIHPTTLPTDPLPLEPSWHKELEPLDTTHDGFEKYLDPYLTTSRLHHRPYTADQLCRESNAPARTVTTYYTFSSTPMVRTPKPKTDFWRLPHPKPKSTYDREKFKEDIRVNRTHIQNKPVWVPGSFRTEIRDNFTSFMEKPEYRIRRRNYEENVQSMYQKALASLPPNAGEEYTATLQGYTTENSAVGSQKPLCATFDPFREKNKRLEIRESKSARKV